jgi:cytochrome P450 family 142 subfamily A polypeptide 1
MLALLRHPGELRKLRDRPDLLPAAVEEVLRYTSVVRGLRRTALREAELGGRRIRGGDSLVLVYPSANRDEAVFEAPDEFRVERDPRDHLTFGIGTHFCLGANLARMELRVVIGRILQRLPELRLDPAGPPVFGSNAGIASIARLPVLLGRSAA